MPATQRFLTLPNLLSLSRLPLGFAFALALASPRGGPWAALLVLAVAGVTDALDGRLARRDEARRLGTALPIESPSGTGSWLDPICDKFFVATVLGAIWFHSGPSPRLLALIVARELAQLPLSLVYAAIPALRHWLRYDFRASLLGKAATVFQFAAITALLFRSSLAMTAATVSCAAGFLALAEYVWRAVQTGRRRQLEARAASAVSVAQP